MDLVESNVKAVKNLYLCQSIDSSKQIIMDDEIKNVDSITQHWQVSSDQDYATMLNLINTKDYS